MSTYVPARSFGALGKVTGEFKAFKRTKASSQKPKWRNPKTVKAMSRKAAMKFSRP